MFCDVESHQSMTQALSDAFLEVEQLHFSYPDQLLFTRFSATVPAGITLIRGGDGCGKSTLLKLLAGTLPAQSGQLHINGIDLQTQPVRYKNQVFLVEPRTDVFDQLTMPDYFEVQRSSHAGFDRSLLAEVTDGLGLAEHLHKQLFMLSTGTKRKVFLAAAFASGAPVTLLDEPFAALDAASIGFALRWLQNPAVGRQRAWVIADYAAPDGLTLFQTINLTD